MRCVAVAGLYFALALLGLHTSLPGSIAATIWPAAGFALGVVLVWGPRCAAGVYLGALGKDLWLGVSLGGALLSALGPLLQVLAGYWLTRDLIRRKYPLQERADIVRFLVLAGPLSCLVSASLAAVVLLKGGMLPAHQLAGHWFTWWSGDVLGVTLFAPLTLLLLPGGPPLRTVSRTAVAAPLLLAATVLAPLHIAYDLYEENRARLDLERTMDQAFDGFHPELHRHLAALESVERFIIASETVTGEEFAEFTGSILRRPAVLAVEWLPRVRQAERAAFERAPARDGRGRVEIVERDASGGLVRAGLRAEYFPVALAEAFPGGQAELGVDRASESSRQAAMARARDGGAMVAALPLQVQPGGRAGIVVFLPVYRRGFESAKADATARREVLRGFAAMVLDRKQLFAPLAADAEKLNLNFRVTDLDLAGADAVLGGNWPESLPTDARADRGRVLEVAGRRWQLEMRAAMPSWHGAESDAGKLLDTLLVLVAVMISFGVLSGNGRAAVLAASEGRFRGLMQNLNGMVYRCCNDPDWSVEFASKGCRELLGLEPEDLAAGRPTYGSLIHPDDSARVWDEVQAALAQRLSWRIEYRVHHADGNWRWVWEQGAGVWDGRGELSHLEGFIADIDARKRAEQALRDAAEELEQRVEERTRDLATANAALARSELATRALVDNLVDCVISIDDEGIIQSANRAVENVLGYGAAELVGRNVSLLMMPSVAASHDAYLEGYRHGGAARIIGVSRQVEGRHKDGSPIALELSVSEYFVDGRRYFTGILRDIRDRLRVVRELEHARRDAEQASQAKSAFLAVMSHEIRTPLNGVIGMVDVLHQTSLKGYQVEIVDTIRDSAYSLLGIIEDILDFSKIEAGRLELEREPMSVSAVLVQVCKMLDHLAAKKGVELTLFLDPELPAQILGDALRLRQVLVNLANNAIKFSSGMQRAGKVSLRARLGSRDSAGATVEFEVTDNGIGMDELTRARLFSAFTQADVSTTRRFGGTGLGLAIAANLAQIMGGEITVRSAFGAGSTFIARIPFVPLPEPPGASAIAPQLAGLHCMVVGHSPGLADDLVVYLAHAGAAVVQVPDLAQARAKRGGASLEVWIIDAPETAPAADELLFAAAVRPQRDLRFVLIGRGQRRTPRLQAGGWVAVDANVLDPRTFLDAVVMAAGQPPLEVASDSAAVVAAGADAGGTTGRHAAAGASVPAAPGRRPPVLVAEDNATNQKVILRQLALLGYAADVAGDGLEALELWKSNDYALLLTDLHMPSMDGYELTLAIRAAEGGARRLPIIALTANALKDEAVRCRAVGMDDYLSKPVKLETLGELLRRWLAVEPVAATAAVAVAPAPTPAALDVGVLRALVGENPDVIREVLQVFRASATSIAAELAAACAAGEAEAAARAAHKLKSAARAAGALPLGDICADIEHAGRSGDHGTLAALLVRFEHEVAVVCGFLDAMPNG